MGELVFAAGASHSPGITGMTEQADPEQAARFFAGMEKIRQAFEAARPDVIIEFTNEHFVNFYLHNMPSICIGTGASHFGPIEPWLRIEQKEVPGSPDLAWDLAKQAVNSGFDVSFSEDLALDHGSVVPLHFITPELDVPLVPIFVNNLVDPMPLPRRIYQLGQLVRQVVAARPKHERVAVLATGGLSHWVGTPETGQINAGFDQRALEAMERGLGADLGGNQPAGNRYRRQRRQRGAQLDRRYGGRARRKGRGVFLRADCPLGHGLRRRGLASLNTRIAIQSLKEVYSHAQRKRC